MKIFSNLAVFMLLVTTCLSAQQAPKVIFEDVTTVYHMETIGKDVYAFISPEPKTPIVSGNVVAIVGKDSVLVVDSGHFPKLTRSMVADLRKKTSKPLRFLVNTHWHEDHNVGNSVFAEEYPGVAIISTPFTRTAMDDYGPKFLDMEKASLPQTLEQARKILEGGKDRAGKPLTEERKTYLANVLDVVPKFIPQLAESRYLGPNETFTDKLNIDLGGREVRVFWPGNANTAGDAVVYLPDEKLLVTGDVIVWPAPYATGSYIGSWIKVLDNLLSMDVSTIVPGHGPVEHDKNYMQTVRKLLFSLDEQVRQAVAQGLSLEDTQKKVDLNSFNQELNQGIAPRVFAWDNYFFKSAIESAWKEQKGIPVDEDPFPAPKK